MTKSIIVLGANGMLGGSIFRYFSSKNYRVIGSVRNREAYSKLSNQGFKNIVVGFDVAFNDEVEKLIKLIKPNYIINCIGIIKQLEDCKNPISAINFNSLLPHRLAKFCTQEGAKLIHFSTDCVFEGNKGDYKEIDIPDAKDLYGRSKLLGEVDYGEHLTLRTSIIGHEIGSAISLVDWFLSQKQQVEGYSKVIFSGLPTICVAEFLEQYILNDFNLFGLYHLSSKPISKFELLKLIKNKYNLQLNIFENKQPNLNRSLNSNKLKNKTGFIASNWEQLIDKMHEEYTKYFN